MGDDVSPDFYGWVFPKYDHVAVGTGTVVSGPDCRGNAYYACCVSSLHWLWGRRRSLMPMRSALALPSLTNSTRRLLLPCLIQVNKTAIKQYQQATRDRAKVKTEGGQIIRVEAHPIPGEAPVSEARLASRADAFACSLCESAPHPW